MLAERNLRTDAIEEVAAEVSAAQNISRGRAVGQVHYARTLRDRLPAVAKVFATGVIDFRMVLTIIARTENVDDEVIARLDAAMARHAVKWMQFSSPSCGTGSICGWPSSIRPGCGSAQGRDNRYVDIVPSERGDGGFLGHVHAADAAALDQRLDALAATVCEHDPRTTEQRRADAYRAVGPRGSPVGLPVW